MKKTLSFLWIALLLLSASSCAKKAAVVETVNGEMRTYYRLSDNTWECDGHIYKYRLGIRGRMPNAATDSTFVYLSNIEEIPFDRAWKAAGFSSATDDYFSVDEAVLVDW